MGLKRIVKSKQFRKLVKQFMIEESYGACDVNLHHSQFGLVFKPRATDSEIDTRIELFIKRITK